LRIDTHIHIGQFNETYYNPLEIAEIVMSSGIQEMSFSSVSSCIKNVQYGQIEKEIRIVTANASYSPEIVRPFFWYIPGAVREVGYFSSSPCIFSIFLRKCAKIHIKKKVSEEVPNFSDTPDTEGKNKIFIILLCVLRGLYSLPSVVKF